MNPVQICYNYKITTSIYTLSQGFFITTERLAPVIAYFLYRVLFYYPNR